MKNEKGSSAVGVAQGLGKTLRGREVFCGGVGRERGGWGGDSWLGVGVGWAVLDG